MVRQMHHICNNDTLRSIYFAYFHSIASYGIILWGNSSYSKKIFTLQKKIIRIMMGAHHRTSGRELFKIINQLFTSAQHLLLLIIGLHVSTDHSVIFRSLICCKFQGAAQTFGIPVVFTLKLNHSLA